MKGVQGNATLLEERNREIAAWLQHIRDEYQMEPTVILRLRALPNGDLGYEVEYTATDPARASRKRPWVEDREYFPSVRYKTLWGCLYAVCHKLAHLCDGYRCRHGYTRSDR